MKTITPDTLARARSAAPDCVLLFVSRTGQAIGIRAYGNDASLLVGLRGVRSVRDDACEEYNVFHCCGASGLQSLLSELIALGHRVAICEQTKEGNLTMRTTAKQQRDALAARVAQLERENKHLSDLLRDKCELYSQAVDCILAWNGLRPRSEAPA